MIKNISIYDNEFIAELLCLSVVVEGWEKDLCTYG